MIPKVPVPQNAGQYRPILCCNVVYKTISNLICKRLKEIIGSLVAENQATFVRGRSLVHNVLIYHDLLRNYNRKTTPICMMKIDLRKKYDMVSWEFVEQALHGYDFPTSFIKLITVWVTSTKLSVKINGEEHDYFDGRRGLRQGDPCHHYSLYWS